MMKTANTIQNVKVCQYDKYPSNMPYWPGSDMKSHIGLLEIHIGLGNMTYWTNQYDILDWLVNKGIIA